MDIELSKAYGCLAGVAIGDAMGSPTTFMSPEEIREKYGFVRNFIKPPKEHLIHGGLKAGQVTDDTEMTLLVAHSIISCEKIDTECYVKHLLRWVLERGLLETDYLGPSTRSALLQIIQGVSIEKSGMFGTTNGAAAKISPIGIVNRRNLEKTVNDVYKICLPTHGTNIAISAAAAVACAISAAFNDDSDVNGLLEAAIYGAKEGYKLGFRYPSAPVVKRIELALRLIEEAKNEEDACRLLYEYVGMGVAANESIPSAIGIIKLANGDPIKAITLAVNCGGDSDTIASIVGGICGALQGIDAFPKHYVEVVEEINGINLREVAEKLLTVRG
ncbi:MAG: ADP-ribosylglycohydrolase family protein [Candidatus Bathyarchaeia archaeon]